VFVTVYKDWYLIYKEVLTVQEVGNNRICKH